MGKTEERTKIYPKKDQQHAKQEAKLAEWDGTEANKNAIQAFSRHLLAKGTGKYRVAKIMGHMRRLCDLVPQFEFYNATPQDIENALAAINTNEDWGKHSKLDYKRVIKHFYNHHKRGDKREDKQDFYDYIDDTIKLKKPKKKVGEDEIISEEDCRHLIKRGCRTELERALVAVLHNTGCRVGELLNMRVRDYKRNGAHGMIRVDGKTGERNIPVLEAIPWLERWLEIHPDGQNPNSLLWVSTSERHYAKPLRYHGVRTMLKRVFERAGSYKACNAHWFRHSRATIWAGMFSQAMLCKLMGWTQGSEQASTYVHLSAKDLENAFTKAYGLTEEEEEHKPYQTCKCGETNTQDAKYCHKCGQPLRLDTALEDEEAKQRAISEALEYLHEKILENPEKLARYKLALKEVSR